MASPLIDVVRIGFDRPFATVDQLEILVERGEQLLKLGNRQFGGRSAAEVNRVQFDARSEA